MGIKKKSWTVILTIEEVIHRVRKNRDARRDEDFKEKMDLEGTNRGGSNGILVFFMKYPGYYNNT